MLLSSRRALLHRYPAKFQQIQLILWFGLGVQSRIAVVYLFAVFVVIINTMTGVMAPESAIIDRQPMQPSDVPITFADISKSRQMLGYNPTTKIADTGHSGSQAPQSMHSSGWI